MFLQASSLQQLKEDQSVSPTGSTSSSMIESLGDVLRSIRNVSIRLQRLLLLLLWICASWIWRHWRQVRGLLSWWWGCWTWQPETSLMCGLLLLHGCCLLKLLCSLTLFCENIRVLCRVLRVIYLLRISRLILEWISLLRKVIVDLLLLWLVLLLLCD